MFGCPCRVSLRLLVVVAASLLAAALDGQLFSTWENGMAHMSCSGSHPYYLFWVKKRGPYF